MLENHSKRDSNQKDPGLRQPPGSISKPRLGFISNPYAKSNLDQKDIFPKIKAMLDPDDIAVQTQSLGHLEDIIRQLFKEKVSIIAIHGGDGTISHCLSIISKIYPKNSLPKILIIAGGTMNILAKNLGIPLSPQRRMQRFFAHRDEPVIQKLKPISVEGHLGFIYADGLAVSFLEEFYLNKGSAWASVKLAVKMILGIFIRNEYYAKLHQNWNPTISVDQRAVSHTPVLMNLVAAVPYFSFGIKFFREHKKSLQSITFKMDLARFALLLPFSILSQGRPFNPTCQAQSGKFYAKGKHIQINSSSPFHYTIDGELFKAHGNIQIARGTTFSFIC